MDETTTLELRRAALDSEEPFRLLHEQVQRLVVLTINAARKGPEDMLGVAARTDEAINSAYAAIHQLRKVKDQANWVYRNETQEERIANDA